MRELRAECKSLMDQLQAQSAADTASMQLIESELSRSRVDSAPAQAPDSPPSQAPVSTQGDSSELSGTELTRQLEEAAVKISSQEADIVSLHAQVVTREAEFESSRAALSSELALMTQQAEQLSSERDQATQRAESSFAEQDTFAEKARELEAELAESTLRTESLSAEKEELKQQLEGLLAGAKQSSEAQDEVQKLQGQLSQLQEQLLQREEEVRRLEEEQGQLHQKVQSLEEEAQESFEQLTGKEEVLMLSCTLCEQRLYSPSALRCACLSLAAWTMSHVTVCRDLQCTTASLARLAPVTMNPTWGLMVAVAPPYANNVPPFSVNSDWSPFCQLICPY